MKSFNSVESSPSNQIASISSIVRFTVSYKDDSIDTFRSVHYRGVLNYLMDDDQVQALGAKEFDKERECRWTESAEQDYILDNVERLAEEVGYQITEIKS